MEDFYVGIDLGTTYSCVAVYKNNEPDIVLNEQGNRTTASYICFKDDECIVGDIAKMLSTRYPDTTIYDLKRLIGKKYSDEDIKFEKNFLPYKIINDNDRIKIKINENDFCVEELVAILLKKLKKNTEDYLGQEIKDVIITVPAYFNDAQRQATKDAGEIAGLNVTRIINEPTASAIAYGLNNNENKIILVYDFGGGTLDVSILELYNGVFEVKSTSGNTRLGGEDFDRILMLHCLEEFCKQNKYSNIKEKIKKILENTKLIQKLKTECEFAKRTLSNIQQTTINIDYFYDEHNLIVNISRSKFEDLCSPLFKKCLEPVSNAMQASNINDIDELILVGGTTKIPKIKEMLEGYLKKKSKCNINPDEAIAIGASIESAIIGKSNDEKIKDIVLMDVIPLSLGIEINNNIMEIIISRNTHIPIKKNKIFTTCCDNQPSIKLKIFEGERLETKYNNLLGEFELIGLPPALRGELKIKVIFKIDVNGILSITAKELISGLSKEIIINNKHKLSNKEINEMITNSEKYKFGDNEINKEIKNKFTIENFIYGIKLALTNIYDENKRTIILEKLKLLEYHNNENVNDIIDEITNILL